MRASVFSRTEKSSTPSSKSNPQLHPTCCPREGRQIAQQLIAYRAATSIPASLTLFLHTNNSSLFTTRLDFVRTFACSYDWLPSALWRHCKPSTNLEVTHSLTHSRHPCRFVAPTLVRDKVRGPFCFQRACIVVSSYITYIHTL